MPKKNHNEYSRHFIAIGIVILALYVLGSFFPEELWAFHAPGIFPLWVTVLIFVFVFVSFLIPLFTRDGINLKNRTLEGPQKTILFLAIASGMGFAFLSFPLASDFYGDAVYIKSAVDIRITEWDNRLISELVQPRFIDTKVGIKTYYHINNILTWLTGANGTQVSLYFQAIVGGIYVFLWLKFIDLMLSKRGWKILLSILGLTLPVLTVFTGHYETYFLSYTGILIWIISLSVFFKSRSLLWLIALPFIFIFILQSHITNWLFFPSLIIAYVWYFKTSKENSKASFVSWKNAIRFCFVPMLLLGAIAYFFIFENHNGPREFSKEEFEDTLFLPMYTDEPAPFDRYNLFGFSHLLDYFNLMFMWSGATLLLLIPALTFLRKKIQWNNPLVISVGVSAISFFVIFFFLNPLLGPTIDWDLFSTPGLVILPFVVILYAQLEEKIKLKSIAGPVFGLSLLASTMLIVNSSSPLLSRHMELIGKRNFKTYWIGCSTELIASADLGRDETERITKLIEYANELEESATEGNDIEYAAILRECGVYYRLKKQNVQALQYFEDAHSYSPLLADNIFQLVVVNFELGKMSEAYRHMITLEKMSYEPYMKTLKMGIHVSLAAKEYQSAANYSVKFLNIWPDDTAVQEVEQRLRTGDRIESIVEIFDSE